MATPVQLARRFNRFVRTRSGVGVVRKLAMLWGLLAVGAGIIIPLFAQPHIQSHTFHGTFTMINPAIWGLTFLTIGAFVLVTLVSAKVELTSYLLFLLSVIICLMAITTSGTFLPGGEPQPGEGGAQLVTWMLVVLALAIMIVGSAVDVPEQKRDQNARH